MSKGWYFKKRIMQPFILLAALLPVGSGVKGQVNARPVTVRPVQGPRIAWDYNSLQRLAPQKGRQLSYAGYPRVKRFRDGRVVSVYEAGGSGELIQSFDDGRNWGAPVVIFKTFYVPGNQKDPVRIHISNVEIIELKNGLWVAACNYRPQKDSIAPFSIVITKSADKGTTWTAPEIIFKAGNTFKDGCWEPAFLQLPNGELHIYFANEAPYTASDEQEISVMSSADDGATWTAPQTVSLRKGKRDGMPAPLMLGDEILVAIEDNKTDLFKPYIVRSPLAEPWRNPVWGDSPQRTYALEEPLPDAIYGGAPYLAKLPSGEIVLSYQTTSGRSSDWELSTMEVAIGDRNGRRFGKTTQPFPVPVSQQAKWNAIALWDEKTVVASSATNFDGSGIGAWMILGRIIPALTSKNRDVTVNGMLDTAEWRSNMPVFIGHKGPVQLTAAVQHNRQHLFFGVKVSGNQPEVQDPEKNGVNIYIDAYNQSLQQPDKGVYKIECSKNGRIRVYEGSNGAWKLADSRNVKMKMKGNNAGYDLELSVPFDLIKKKDRHPIRVNMELLSLYGDKNGYSESIVHATPRASGTWCEVRFK